MKTELPACLVGLRMSNQLGAPVTGARVPVAQPRLAMVVGEVEVQILDQTVDDQKVMGRVPRGDDGPAQGDGAGPPMPIGRGGLGADRPGNE